MRQANVELQQPLSGRQGLKQSQSLRWRLLFLLGAVLSGTFIFIGAGVAYFVFLTEEAAWQGRQEEAARNAAETVTSFIQNIEDKLTLISLLESDYFTTTPQALQDILEQNSALLEIIRVDAQGRIFATAHRDAPVLSNVFTISQSQWFLETTAGRSYISNVQISSQDEPYLIIAVPVAAGGAVAARLQMDVLWNVVNNIRFGQEGRAYVIDQKGRIIAHPNTDIVLQNTAIADRPEVEAIVQTPTNRWQGSYSNFESVWVVGVTNPIPGTTWVIITELPRSEAFAVTRSALLLLGVGLFIFGGIIVNVTMPSLQRLLFTPMEQLRSGAERIGRGDLSYQINLTREDEVGQVAQAFNDMASHLQDREEKLLLARDQALEASRLKSELLAKVSHELRTPLNAILGYTEMIQEGIYGPILDEQNPPLEKIIQSTNYLTELISELLNQAQLEAGRITLHLSNFSPNELLDDVHGKMNGLAQAKGVNLTAQIAHDVPPILCGDPARLQQILVNLVGNAIKFTETGSVKIYFSRPDQDHWAIQVTDTGPGIPRVAHSYIFEPFRQVDGSLTRLYGGTGLGLSIVKQLTILMGGNIALESELGRGSIFTITLPLVFKQEQTHDQPKDAQKASSLTH